MASGEWAVHGEWGVELRGELSVRREMWRANRASEAICLWRENGASPAACSE